MRDEGHVQDDPAEHARSEFAERFDVQGANQGEIDSRVQLTANEPIVDDVARMAAGGELALQAVALFDGEAANIDVGSEEGGDANIGRDELNIIFPDEGPEWEVGALERCAGRCYAERDEGGVEGVEFVFQLAPRRKLDTFGFLAWENHLKRQAEDVISQHP